MSERNSFWDHEKRPMDGWQQTGDIHGAVHGCWFQHPNSSISIGDETQRYWLRIRSCYHGHYATPEEASAKALEILAEEFQ